MIRSKQHLKKVTPLQSSNVINKLLCFWIWYYCLKEIIIKYHFKSLSFFQKYLPTLMSHQIAIKKQISISCLFHFVYSMAQSDINNDFVIHEIPQCLYLIINVPQCGFWESFFMIDQRSPFIITQQASRCVRFQCFPHNMNLHLWNRWTCQLLSLDRLVSFHSTWLPMYRSSTCK